MKSNSTETNRRKKIVFKFLTKLKENSDVKSKHTLYTTCTAFLLSHKTKWKLETKKKKRKGAGSVFTSVLPDDTKRSLLYGNVLVMSRLITLDSVMAPTAHTQLSV